MRLCKALGSGLVVGVSVHGGSSSSVAAANQLRLISQDNFGEDLIFNVRGGGIYYWDESSGTGARAINATALGGASNVPTVRFAGNGL
jgi:hypothetical protein